MKLQVVLFSVFTLLFNINCRSPFSKKHDNSPMPDVVQDTTGLPDTSLNPGGAANKTVHFGVMVSKTEGRAILPVQQAQVAKALGVKYIRCLENIQTWNGANPAYDAYTASGLKVLLNINYGVPRDAVGGHRPVPFPTDLKAYSETVNAVLDKYKPEVVVVENEEDNPLFHAGEAEDYIAELNTAIKIAHSKGLKVTNGGITVREVCLIIYDDYVQRGEKQKALDFAQSVFPGMLTKKINMNNPQITRQLEFGRKIIAAYKLLDLDYVNFHWYEPVLARMGSADVNADFDPKIFSFVVNYLKTATGKPVMTNELGVLNPSPDLVKSLLQTIRNNSLAYAIFYSADGGEGKAIALQNGSGGLRENGIAFRDFLSQH
jgi:hypothetical protein